MAHERFDLVVCVLPSGRVAVVGGFGADGPRTHGEECEAFDPDPVKRTWEALPEVAITLGNAVGCTGGERDSLRSEE